MTANFDRGMLNATSWHGLETVGTMADFLAMVAAGESLGAWPTELEEAELLTPDGLVAPLKGIVAHYAQHDSRVLGAVGGRYTSTTPAEWRQLVQAACEAGAKPTGAFSLRNGSLVLATFEVGDSNGFQTNMLIVDSFDGSTRLCAGSTTIRVVCCNTLDAAFRSDGKSMAKLRHTRSLPDKIAMLEAAIKSTIEKGEATRDAYRKATEHALTRSQAEAIFDLLWPHADETKGVRAHTRAENARADAAKAMRNPLNNEGKTLATFWNAATWLVDRRVDGSQRACRGGAPMLDSLLFGSRANRLAEIQKIVEVQMRDGSVEALTVSEAKEHGLNDSQIGSAIIADMLS